MKTVAQQLFRLLRLKLPYTQKQALSLISKSPDLDEMVLLEDANGDKSQGKTLRLISYLVIYEPNLLNTIIRSQLLFKSSMWAYGVHTAIASKKNDVALQILHRIKANFKDLSSADKAQFLVFAAKQKDNVLFSKLLEEKADANHLIAEDETVLSYLITHQPLYAFYVINHPDLKSSRYSLIALRAALQQNNFHLFRLIFINLQKPSPITAGGYFINDSCSTQKYLTLLEVAIEKESIPFIDFLMSNDSNPYLNSSLLFLIQSKQASLALAIINHNQFIFNENTLPVLLTALFTDQDDVVIALLNKNIDTNLNLATFNNLNALEIAQQKNKVEIVALLERCGAAPNYIPKVLPEKGFKNKTNLLQDMLAHPNLFSDALCLEFVKRRDRQFYRNDQILIKILKNGQLNLANNIIRDLSYQIYDYLAVSIAVIKSNDETLILSIYNRLPREFHRWFTERLNERRAELAALQQMALVPAQNAEQTNPCNSTNLRNSK